MSEIDKYKSIKVFFGEENYLELRNSHFKPTVQIALDYIKENYVICHPGPKNTAHVKLNSTKFVAKVLEMLFLAKKSCLEDDEGEHLVAFYPFKHLSLSEILGPVFHKLVVLEDEFFKNMSVYESDNLSNFYLYTLDIICKNLGFKGPLSIEDLVSKEALVH